jgi:amidase
VFGLKPSRGRNPVGPRSGEVWQGVVCEHVLTRTVRDSAAMLDATWGIDVGAPYTAPEPEQPFLDAVGTDPGKLRIAFTTESLLGSHVDEACVRGVESTVELLRELGHEVVQARPSFDRRAFLRAYITMVSVETAADLVDCAQLLGRRKLPARGVELETRVMALFGRKVGTVAFARACRHLARVTREVAGFFADGNYDVLLTPTLAKPPIPTGSLRATTAESTALRLIELLRAGNTMRAVGIIDTMADKVFEFSAYCPLFNVSGQPAVSMPLHWSDDGLPVGMHFVARYGREVTLFRLAGQLEQARPWIDRSPQICA